MSNARPLPRRSLGLVTALAVHALAPTAWAGEVLAVAPLLPGKGIKADKARDIFGLVQSSLDFMSGIDEVVPVGTTPSSTACLLQTSCLKPLATEGDADHLITGTIDQVGSSYVMELVYYDATGNRIVNRKKWTFPADSGALLETVESGLRELRTGVSTAAAVAAEEEEENVDFLDDDDDALELEDEPVYTAPRPSPATPPAPKPTTTAAASSTRPTTPAPAPKPPPPPPEPEPEPVVEDDFDPSMFTLSVDPNAITFGEPVVPAPEPEPKPTAYDEDDDEETSWRAPAVTPTPEPKPRPTAAYADDDDEDDDEAAYRAWLAEREAARNGTPAPREDDERPTSRSNSTASRGPVSSATLRQQVEEEQRKEYRRLTVTTRGGYTNYGIFNFGTVGLGASVRVVAGLAVDVGVDLHIVRRALPPDVAAASGKAVETNFIAPLNAGLLYRFKAGIAHPYVGADAVFSHIRTACLDGTTNPESTLTPGACADVGSAPPGTYVQNIDYATKQNWTVGGRGRVGVDVHLSRHVGINVDVAMGGWKGTDWPNIDPRLKVSGFVPHFSGGLLFGF
jgi:hypothetical protein